jgi:hypothetical protein
MDRIDQGKQKLSTPRAAAVAGILSGLLFIAANLLLRYAIPRAQAETDTWSVENAGSLSLALNLVPFAGIAFLWFIGVARDRLGKREDQFFSTVFLGSGLLYLAMTFIAAAIAGGLLGSYLSLKPTSSEAVLMFSTSTIGQITNIFSIRMAAVFMISSATMWYQTKVMPRLLALLTYVLALGLLVLINFSLWVTLIFPVWMLSVSILILIINYRRPTKKQDSVPV